MITVKDADELQALVAGWKADGLKVGFVPTMGALHDGHLSLMRMAKEKADKVVVSIYVNPTQFAPHEDFDAYPRDVEADATLLDGVGVDALYLPLESDIYPDGASINVQAGKAAEGLETEFRPHFFHGVATVVHRLFEVVQPDLAVFGEKDFQQLQVIKEMVTEKDMGIEIIGGPIARDEYGLALSSRNAYLSEDELEIARMLNQVLYMAAHDPRESTLEKASQMLLNAGFDKVDYISYRENWNRTLVAAWIGKTRLIDNCDRLHSLQARADRAVIKPLPRIPVIRETYCSQQMTDDIMDYLEKNDPGGRYSAAYHILASTNLESSSIELGNAIGRCFGEDSPHHIAPDSIQMIDLIFELARRIRKAKGDPEPQITGTPLAPHINGPYPDVEKLPKIKIDAKSIKAGLTQEMADRAITALYKYNPEIFYLVSESWRRDYSNRMFKEYKVAFEEIEKKHSDIDIEHNQIAAIRNEVALRVGVLCKIPMYLGLKEIRDEQE